MILAPLSDREKVEDEEKEVNVNPFQNLELYLSSHFSFLFLSNRMWQWHQVVAFAFTFLIFNPSFQSIVL